MILGISTTLFTQIHVAISLIGIATGFIVVFGMIAGKRLPVLTAIFLATTILTNVTGFFYPFHGMTPGIVVGILSLVILAFTLIALYSKHLAGGWRRTYVITAVIALYFNFFVLIVQSFMKVPSLHALAPTGSEPPFKIAQAVTLVVFVVLTVLADKKFRVASTA
ncbi:MAG: hypothetical protein P4L10_14825 [Acidobacteriaceae bacterium]|nr:hypothetical protein [Acidobacteriaceae bacterium]